MKISMIVAMTREGVIGLQHQLPWHLPADLKWFKTHTVGKPVIMGRKTFESLKKPLKNRLNIVLSHQFRIGCAEQTVQFVQNKQEALLLCHGVPECMVIGGASVYQAFFQESDKLYITWIEKQFSGDAYFPVWDRKEWSLTFEEHHEPDAENTFPYTFTCWERITPSHYLF